MSDTVFVSRLGRVLRGRRMRVADLQRRLHERGHPVSRGALDRLMSERPVHTVDLDVLMPVLEELNVDFASAFARVPTETAEALESARPEARDTARRLAREVRRKRLAEADAELDDVADRLERELKDSHPELFDARGRLRQRVLSRLLLEQFGGKRVLSGQEFWELTHRDEQASPIGAA
jgi:hypothetical protein